MVFNLVTSGLSTLLRLGAGRAHLRISAAYVEPIILYEFEGCPFCRIAREALSETGVTALMKPCPKKGTRFRGELVERGGKAQFPYMIDPNTDVEMYESADIAAYLHKTYGGTRPLIHKFGPINSLLATLGIALRLRAGTFAKPSTAPDKPLELFGSERSINTRLVKERLCELEITYYWSPIAHGGEPRLMDPNTENSVDGARHINEYLKQTYAA